MRGARSGKVRKIALMRVEHEGRYALIASYGGSDENPAWYDNIVDVGRDQATTRNALQELTELVELARSSGIRLIGPNAFGLVGEDANAIAPGRRTGCGPSSSAGW